MTVTVEPPAGIRPLNDVIAENIRIQLAIRRMSQAELGRRLGHSNAWMSYKMLGKTQFDADDLQRVGALFDIDPSKLLVTTRQLSPVRSRPVDRPTNRHDSTRPTPTGGRRNVVLRKAAA